MPRKKKTAREMTTEELIRSVLPKKVVDQLKKDAHSGEETEEPKAGEDRK